MTTGISTHAPLAGRDARLPVSTPEGRTISTHAPLAGRDLGVTAHSGTTYISTHAPLAGRDGRARWYTIPKSVFQPTRPLRGATNVSPNQSIMLVFQPTRPLRGATGTEEHERNYEKFQPTRPLRGATPALRKPLPACFDFNPRAPCGARQQKCTNHYAHFCDNRQISDAFAQNAACQGILLLFDAGKPCGFWVRTAQVISARLCFAL